MKNNLSVVKAKKLLRQCRIAQQVNRVILERGNANTATLIQSLVDLENKARETCLQAFNEYQSTLYEPENTIDTVNPDNHNRQWSKGYVDGMLTVSSSLNSELHF